MIFLFASLGALSVNFDNLASQNIQSIFTPTKAEAMTARVTLRVYVFNDLWQYNNWNNNGADLNNIPVSYRSVYLGTFDNVPYSWTNNGCANNDCPWDDGHKIASWLRNQGAGDILNAMQATGCGGNEGIKFTQFGVMSGENVSEYGVGNFYWPIAVYTGTSSHYEPPAPPRPDPRPEPPIIDPTPIITYETRDIRDYEDRPIYKEDPKWTAGERKTTKHYRAGEEKRKCTNGYCGDWYTVRREQREEITIGTGNHKYRVNRDTGELISNTREIIKETSRYSTKYVPMYQNSTSYKTVKHIDHDGNVQTETKSFNNFVSTGLQDIQGTNGREKWLHYIDGSLPDELMETVSYGNNAQKTVNNITTRYETITGADKNEYRVTVSELHEVDSSNGNLGRVIATKKEINNADATNKYPAYVHEEPIKAKVKYVADENLTFGEQKVEVAPKDGKTQYNAAGWKRKETSGVLYKDFTPEEKQYTKIKILTPAVDGITHVGNKKVTHETGKDPNGKTYDVTVVNIHDVDPNTGKLTPTKDKKTTPISMLEPKATYVHRETVKAKVKFIPDENLTFGEQKVEVAPKDGTDEITEVGDYKTGDKKVTKKTIVPVVNGITHVGNKKVTHETITGKDGNHDVTVVNIHNVDPDTGKLTPTKDHKTLALASLEPIATYKHNEPIKPTVKYVPNDNLDFGKQHVKVAPKDGVDEVTEVGDYNTDHKTVTHKTVVPPTEGITEVGNKKVTHENMPGKDNSNHDVTVTNIHTVNPKTGNLTPNKDHKSLGMIGVMGNASYSHHEPIKAKIKYVADENIDFGSQSVEKPPKDGDELFVTKNWTRPSSNGNKTPSVSYGEFTEQEKKDTTRTVIRPAEDGITHVGSKKVTHETINGGDGKTYDVTVVNIHTVDPNTGKLTPGKDHKTLTPALVQGKATYIHHEPIKATVKFVPDENLEFGKQKVEVAPKDGVDEVTEVGDYKTKDKKVTHKTITPPVEGITHVGNKKVTHETVTGADGKHDVTVTNIHTVDPKTGKLTPGKDKKVMGMGEIKPIATYKHNETIPASTVYQPDENLPFGEKKVETPAVNGVDKVTEVGDYKSKDPSKNKVTHDITQPQTGVVRVGNKKVTHNTITGADGNSYDITTTNIHTVAPNTGKLIPGKDHKSMKAAKLVEPKKKEKKVTKTPEQPKEQIKEQPKSTPKPEPKEQIKEQKRMPKTSDHALEVALAVAAATGIALVESKQHLFAKRTDKK